MVSQWVVKVSKFCNLRCDYCYELPELGDRTRMSLAQAAAMFDHIAGYSASRRAPSTSSGTAVSRSFRSLDYFRRLFALQRRSLAGHAVENFVQTNLTMLDDDRLALLATTSAASESASICSAIIVSTSGGGRVTSGCSPTSIGCTAR